MITKANETKRGHITTSSGYPKIFRSIYDYDKKFSERQYYAQGWRDVVTPAIDTNTQYLGSMFYDRVSDTFTYTVNTLSNGDQSNSFVEKVFLDGEKYYKEVLSKIYEAYYNNDFSPSDVINNQERRALIDFVGSHLKMGALVGDWEWSQTNLEDPSSDAISAKALSIIGDIVAYVNNYVNNNF